MNIPYSGPNDLVFSAICTGYSIQSSDQTQQYINAISNGTSRDNDAASTAAGGTTYMSWNINPPNADWFNMFGGSFRAAVTATKLQMKGGKLQVVASTGTSTPVTQFKWVQGLGYFDFTGTRNSITTSALTSSTTTGNTIICSAHIHDYIETVTSITDSRSDTFQHAVSANNTNDVSGWEIELWFASNITGGSNVTITGTWANSTTVQMFLLCNEYSGLLTSGALDQTASYSSNDHMVTLGPVTTSYDHELVVYAISNETGGTPNTMCGWNDFTRENYYVEYFCDYMQDTAGKTAAWYWNNNTGNHPSVLATFRKSDAKAQVK